MTLDDLITTKRGEVLALVRDLWPDEGLMLVAVPSGAVLVRTVKGLTALREAADLSCSDLASVIKATAKGAPEGFRLVYACGTDHAALYHVPVNGDPSAIRTVVDAFNVQEPR